MSNSDSAQLIDLLRDAQIVKPSVLDEFLKNREVTDPRRLAQQLIEAQLLTSWQAKFLLSGRNRLRVSGYLLRDRVSRSPLGDLFSATHETLARHVDLLILPAGIKRDDQRFQHFLRISSNLTQLDHPRLAHVYDIGEKGGRFFIVSEQVDRLPISDFSPAEVLSEYQRAVIAFDWWQALDYLHQQSLAHGRIDELTALIDEGQRGKISQLAQSLLQSQVLSQDSALELAERTALDQQQLARQIEQLLFRENLIGSALSCQHAVQRVIEGNKDFWKILGQTLQDLASSLRSNETLMNMPTAGSPAPIPTTISGSASGELPLDASLTVYTNTPLGNKPISKTGMSSRAKSAGAKSSSSKTTTRSNASKRELSAETWVRHGLTLVGICALGAMLTTVWWFNQRGSADPAVSQIDSTEGQANNKTPLGTKLTERNNISPTNGNIAPDEQSTEADKIHQNNRTSQQPSSGQTVDEDVTKSASTLPNSSATNSDSTKSAGKATPANSVTTNSQDPTATETTSTVDSKIVDETDKKQSPKTQQSKTDKPDPFQVPGSSSKPTLPQASTTSGSPTNQASGPANQAPGPANQASGPANQATGPAMAFSQMPSQLSIATSEMKEAQNLMAWGFAPEKPPTLKLQIHPDVAGKPKLFVELSAIESEQNAWKVELRRRDQEAEAEVVGKFWASDSQLWFQWADGLEKSNDANYLINGRLRISQEGTEKVLALRPTIILEPIKMTKENFSVKRQVDLAWLPASTRVELAELGMHPEWQKTQIDDITVLPKVGRRIDFKILEVEQLCWLLLRADVDRRLTLMLDLFSPDSKNPLKPDEFSAALIRVEQTYAALVAAQAQAENFADVAPYGSRTKAREAASDARKKTSEYKKIRELALEFQTLVTDQLDKELPLRIVYENEDYSIILAQSGNFSDKVEETKPRTRSDR